MFTRLLAHPLTRVPIRSQGGFSTRLFVCCELESDVRSSLAHAMDALKESRSKVSWTPVANLHITLKFLGDTEEKLLPDIRDHLRHQCRGLDPFSVSLVGIGAFPTMRRPRVIWAGIQMGHEQVIDLHQRIESALTSVGFSPEPRAFHPHVTLGRVRPHSDTCQLAQSITEQGAMTFGTSHVSEVILMQSQLRPTGALHSPLERIRFSS